MWFKLSYSSIHAEAPEFVEMSLEQEILETGIKVIDMLAPYVKGGKIGRNRSAKSYSVLLVIHFTVSINKLHYIPHMNVLKCCQMGIPWFTSA